MISLRSQWGGSGLWGAELFGRAQVGVVRVLLRAHAAAAQHADVDGWLPLHVCVAFSGGDGARHGAGLRNSAVGLAGRVVRGAPSPVMWLSPWQSLGDHQ